jgi:hypothetical protein
MVSQTALLENARIATLKLIQKEVKEQTPIKQKMGKEDKVKDYARRLKKLSENINANNYPKAFEKITDILATFVRFSNFNNAYGFSESDKKLLHDIIDMADEEAHMASKDSILRLFFLTALSLKVMNDSSYSSTHSVDLPYIAASSYPIQTNPLYVELYNEANALSYNAAVMKVEESNKTGMFGRYFQGGRTKKRHVKKHRTRKHRKHQK